MKNTKEILKLSIDQIDNLFELIPVAISVSSIEEGRFIYSNKAFKKFIHYDKAYILGKTSVELNLVPPDLREEISRDLIAQNGVNDTESVLKNAHGEKKRTHFCKIHRIK